jgi:hypothetical protein
MSTVFNRSPTDQLIERPHTQALKEKTALVKKLERKYGKNFKTPLSKDLGVHVSTVRRMFNSREEINSVWIVAINGILNQ